MKTFLTSIALVLLGMATAIPVDAETEPCIVVVEKDGSTVSMPMQTVSRIDFDSFSFAITTKSGDNPKYDYDGVDKVIFSPNSSLVTSLPKDVCLAVWPTVTSSTLYVSGIDATTEIRIFSISGRQMLSIAPDSDNEMTEIDVSSFPAGSYILATNNNPSVKFIKK